jgi:hypothetical protein
MLPAILCFGISVLIASQLYGVTTVDIATLAGAASIQFGVALLPFWFPARLRRCALIRWWRSHTNRQSRATNRPPFPSPAGHNRTGVADAPADCRTSHRLNKE